MQEKIQSMPIIRIDDIKANEQDIYLVRRAQAKLALQTDYKNLYEYCQRGSFQKVAKYLVEKYWTQSVYSGRAIVDLVTELYVVWFALLPIACRSFQGYYRPGWGSSIFLSWFRAHVNKYGRYYIGRAPLSWRNPVLHFSAVGISNSAFQDLCSGYLSHCQGHTALPMLSRLVFGPFVFPDLIGQAMDAAKRQNCGIMWWEDEIIFLSTKAFDFPGVYWHDLRRSKHDVLHWNISIKDKLQIVVKKQIIKDIKSRIESIIKSDSTPAHKMVQINNQLRNYYFVAKYTAQASRQTVDLDKWAWNKVAKSIIATKPELKKSYYNLRSQDWDTNFRVGRKSLFLDRDVSLQTWVTMWAPRR